jgi:hypothetical protein
MHSSEEMRYGCHTYILLHLVLPDDDSDQPGENNM